MFGIVLAPFCLSPCDRKVAKRPYTCSLLAMEGYRAGDGTLLRWRWNATAVAMKRYETDNNMLVLRLSFVVNVGAEKDAFGVVFRGRGVL